MLSTDMAKYVYMSVCAASLVTGKHLTGVSLALYFRFTDSVFWTHIYLFIYFKDFIYF